MSDCFILLSAGKSKRFKSKINKQFITYKNKPLFEHSLKSLKTALDSKLFKKVLIVSNKKVSYKNIDVIKGGKERHNSTQNALNFLKNKKIKNVFIHDAARPNLSINLLKKLKKELKNNNAVVPYLKSENSVKYKIKNKINNLDRNKVLLTQTPQCFNFQELFNLYKSNKEKITDEASLYLSNNRKIKFILGDRKNFKITTIDDLNYLKSETYFGIGFDVHRLIKNKKLFLGGIKVPFHSGLKGHSDGDVILHAITDAILGATRRMDIGTYFPNKKKDAIKKKYKIWKK